MLFDIYGEEVTPTKKGSTSRMHDRAATAMFLSFFGRNRDPATLSQRDWGPVHSRAARGPDRTEQKTRVRPDGRIRPQVP